MPTNIAAAKLNITSMPNIFAGEFSLSPVSEFRMRKAARTKKARPTLRHMA